MLKVNYERFCHRLTVEGHAGSAPYGQDLVCSAATILVHTLIANAEHMEQTGIATITQCDLSNGFAVVSCKPIKGSEQAVERVFSVVCVGFEILADKFPEFISYKITG